MKETIIEIFNDSAKLKNDFIKENAELVGKCAVTMIDALKAGNKIMFFGNGGSAADAQHLAAELVNRFSTERDALAAIALNTDTSTITSIANDYSYERIFARQISALGKKGDVAFGISTSGNSKNVVKALLRAKQKDMLTIGLTGKTGGSMKELVDIHIHVDSFNTARVQEVHITIGHAICYLIDQAQLVGKE